MRLAKVDGTTFYVYNRDSNKTHPWSVLAWNNALRSPGWIGAFADKDSATRAVRDQIKLQSVVKVQPSISPAKRSIHIHYEPSSSRTRPWRVREDIRVDGKRLNRLDWGYYATQQEAIARVSLLTGQLLPSRAPVPTDVVPAAKTIYDNLPVRIALTKEELAQLLAQARAEERELINARWKAKLQHLQEIVRDLP